MVFKLFLLEIIGFALNPNDQIPRPNKILNPNDQIFRFRILGIEIYLGIGHWGLGFPAYQ
jgi:hypothetical protein